MAVLVTAALLLWSLALAVIDWRQKRVPNAWLIALLLPALAMLLWRGSGLIDAGWSASLLGLLVAALVTLPGYWVSKFGAGDVKLAAATGFVLGWPLVAHSLVIAGILLGLGALAMVVAAGFTNVRKVRIPAAWSLLGGFAAVLLWQAGDWR